MGYWRPIYYIQWVRDYGGTWTTQRLIGAWEWISTSAATNDTYY